MFEHHSISGFGISSQNEKVYTTNHDLAGKNILYIDDEYVNYLYFAESISETGAVIHRAVTNEQIWHLLNIIEDISLVIISSDYLENFSLSLIHEIKKQNSRLAVGVVVESQDSALIKKYQDAGCDMQVYRHVDSLCLIETVNELLAANTLIIK